MIYGGGVSGGLCCYDMSELVIQVIMMVECSRESIVGGRGKEQKWKCWGVNCPCCMRNHCQTINKQYK